ncbi:MAG: formate/nitrite transporter family protein [Oceanicaulis sp.]
MASGPVARAKKDAENESTDPKETSTVEGWQAERAVSDRVRPSALMVFEIVRREGAEEMTRPSASLFWSGIAAGFALAFSLAASGMLTAILEPGPAHDLIKPLGYVTGFLIVVFGRLQLFTENTIAAILPIVADFRASNLYRMARLYLIVLTANLVGAALAACVMTYTPVMKPDHFVGVLEVARKAMEPGFFETFALGVPAGFLVAAMVWMLPTARNDKFFIVVSIIYLLALGEFAHVIVGSVEVGVLVLAGEMNIIDGMFGFILPALVGNMVGGTVLFALLAYAQIRDETRQAKNRQAKGDQV